MPKRSKRRSVKKRGSVSIVKRVSMITLFFALLGGWIYANYLLVKGHIYPNMIQPIAAKVAATIIANNDRSFTRPSINNYTSVIGGFATLLAALLTEKTTTKYTTDTLVSYIIALWAMWINYNNKALSITSEGLTNQDLLKHSLAFSGLVTTVLGLSKAELYLWTKSVKG